MNEEAREKLELLKIMKDLNGQGFRLNNEINALIKSMLMTFNITDEFFNGNSNVRKGTHTDPYVKINAYSTIKDGKVLLSEVPDKNSKVTIRHSSQKLRELSNDDVKDKEHYYVDYHQGIVYFHESLNDEFVTILYLGKGLNKNKIN